MLNLMKALFPARTPIMTVDVSRLDTTKELRERNELELAKAKEKLGNRWILHHDNRVLSPKQLEAERKKWRAQHPVKPQPMTLINW
jgi:hypothetical protein